MLIPSGRFSLPFTCVDSTGLPTAPTGTPVGTLVKNGVDLVTPVTVTMTGASGVALCTIPSDAVADDRFHIRLSAVIAAVTYTLAGPSEAVEGLQSLASAYDAAKTAAPAAVTIATAVRTELVAELARLDASVSSRLSTSAYTAPQSFTGLATAEALTGLAAQVAALPLSAEIAAEILVNPENKVLSDQSGNVTVANGGGGGGTTFVMPLRSTSVERALPNRIDLFVRERVPLSIAVFDENLLPVNCAGLVCTLFVAGGITIPGLSPTAASSGEVLNCYEFCPTEEMTSVAGSLWFSLRVSDATERVLAFGHVVVADVP